MKRLIRLFACQSGRIAALAAIAGLACALLVRFAPGANVDDREMNLHLGQNSLAQLRAEREAQANLATAFVQYFRQLARGDLGYSVSRNAPIKNLIVETAPETLREIVLGLAGSWLVGLLLALPLGKIWNFGTSLAAGLLLSIPTAFLAYLCFSQGARVEIVFVLALAPRIFRVSKNLFRDAYGSAHVFMARGRGIGEARILLWHILPATAAPLLALAATSVAMGIGAAIPIETICDISGLGRLAWQAALSRDLLLLVNLTMLIAVASTTAMAISEMATAMTPSREAA